MTLYISDAPTDSTYVLYELHEEYDTASAKVAHEGHGRYRRLEPDHRGFRTWIQTEDDFMVRAVVWTPRGGIALESMVTEALKRHMAIANASTVGKVARTVFERAVEDLTDGEFTGSSTPVRRSAKAKKSKKH